MSSSLEKTNQQVKTIQRQFHKINNSLAQLSQDEADLIDKKKELSAKKKALTKSIDEEIKEIKTELKKIGDKRLLTLGERNARLVDLKSLGLKKEVDNQEQKVSAHLRSVEQSVLQN